MNRSERILENSLVEKEQLDLVIIKKGKAEFWGFVKGNWANEFPDAKLFDTLGQAKKVIKQNKLKGIEVVINYGMDNEKVLYSS